MTLSSNCDRPSRAACHRCTPTQKVQVGEQAIRFRANTTTHNSILTMKTMPNSSSPISLRRKSLAHKITWQKSLKNPTAWLLRPITHFFGRKGTEQTSRSPGGKDTLSLSTQPWHDNSDAVEVQPLPADNDAAPSTSLRSRRSLARDPYSCKNSCAPLLWQHD